MAKWFYALVDVRLTPSDPSTDVAGGRVGVYLEAESREQAEQMGVALATTRMRRRGPAGELGLSTVEELMEVGPPDATTELPGIAFYRQLPSKRQRRDTEPVSTAPPLAD